MLEPEVTIEVLNEEEAVLPTYGSAGAAGADIRAYLQTPLALGAGESALVPTGLRLAIPEGYEVQVRPRSGLALKHQVTVLNTPGTIDSDYRGEVGIILINHGKQTFTIEPGMRIAQLVIARVHQARFVGSEALSRTARGEGGFGHTGVN